MVVTSLPEPAAASRWLHKECLTPSWIPLIHTGKLHPEEMLPVWSPGWPVFPGPPLCLLAAGHAQVMRNKYQLEVQSSKLGSYSLLSPAPTNHLF